jgi:4-diphosphocytidyl-2-C-methyl-D-erythritol kinase
VVRAHAKVNLLLRILAREASGYHGIETLFQKLDLHDIVRVRATDATRVLTCDGPRMPKAGLGAPESNLAWRAAEAYAAASGWQTGWDIAIEKHIPVGGGLGGGSADAAAVLRALESMSPRPIGSQSLLDLGAALGADVAFLVTQASLALAWGRGERMLALPSLPAIPVALFAFEHGVNTGAAYGAFARTRETRSEPSQARSYGIDAFNSWPSVGALAANDFESVVMTMHEGVAALLPRIRAARAAAVDRSDTTAGIGQLSGSGATCFIAGELARDVARMEQIAEGTGAYLVLTTTA